MTNSEEYSWKKTILIVLWAVWLGYNLMMVQFYAETHHIVKYVEIGFGHTVMTPEYSSLYYKALFKGLFLPLVFWIVFGYFHNGIMEYKHYKKSLKL